jgi:hypothetical protein
MGYRVGSVVYVRPAGVVQVKVPGAARFHACQAARPGRSAW